MNARVFKTDHSLTVVFLNATTKQVETYNFLFRDANFSGAVDVEYAVKTAEFAQDLVEAHNG